MKIFVEDREYVFPEGTFLKSMAERIPGIGRAALAYVNGRLRELNNTAPDGAEVRFASFTSKEGFEAFRRSASMMFFAAAQELYGNRAGKITQHFTIASGLYFTLGEEIRADEEAAGRIENRMREMSREAMPFLKSSVPTAEARRRFASIGMDDKDQLFRTRIASSVNVYRLGSYEDYYYGYMLPDTSFVRHFEVLPFRDGLILNLPTRQDPDTVPVFSASGKLMDAQLEGERWASGMGIGTVGELNAKIIAGETGHTMLVSEALQERKIAEIAAEIAGRREVKFVMIAGPSSSGKTTFSQRLCTQLSACGMTPHYIGVDNYFLDREDMVPGPDGKIDFEALSAVDTALFNRDMRALLDGETIDVPTFDFIEGKKIYPGEKLRLGDGELLVIEGIHCLNDAMSADLPAKSKYRIYMSALTQLNIDRHNRIPTTDGRLLRRIVRDHRTRGYPAAATIAMWDNVRAGEERNIFPYQESADVFFNSALPYEIAVLKTYAQPLLFQVGEEDPAYQEAKRLLKFLDYFVAVPADGVPVNSIIREFIGGGCFRM